MELWNKRKPKHETEQPSNPLKGKYGFEEPRANAEVEATRKNLLLYLQNNWESVDETQREYFKSVLDFEQAWQGGTVKDWRAFWESPKAQGTKAEVALTGWWHTGGDPTATHKEVVRDYRPQLNALMREAGLLDGIQK
jgi:hypothetical protein